MTGNLFNMQNNLSNYIDLIKERINKQIKSIDEGIFLNQSEDINIDKIFNQYKIDELELYDKEVKLIEGSTFIEEGFVNRFAVNQYEKIEVPEFTFQIPFKGDWKLLEYCPSSYKMHPNKYYVRNNYVYFKLIKFNNDSTSFKKEFNKNIEYLKFMFNSINKDNIANNKELKIFIKGVYKHRKNELIKNNEFLSELGIPKAVSTNEKPNRTYSVPYKINEKIILNSVKNHSLTESLSDEDYYKIINAIYKYASSFESNPSVCKNKDEEGIRDLITGFLQTIFEEQSITAESRNKKGKTDIMVKDAGKIIFIAECKIWGGPKNYGEAITQLLSYLDWKTNKTALIIFVKKEKMSTVLDKIERITSEHPDYIKTCQPNEKNWFNYEFNLESDDVPISLAVMVFKV